MNEVLEFLDNQTAGRLLFYGFVFIIICFFLTGLIEALIHAIRDIFKPKP